MAFLNEIQVAELKKHMTDNPEMLAAKFKAKNSKNVNISVPHNEREAFEERGYEVIHTLKKKVRMSRPKETGDLFEDDIWCMFYKLGFRCLNSDEKLSIPWSSDSSDHHQIDVLAVGVDAIFVVECKAAKNPRSGHFKDEIDVMCRYKDGVIKALRQIYGSSKKVRFIFATRNYRIGDEDQGRMRNNKIFHLNDNTYDYISNLIKSYKESVIYQFYGLMFKDELINNDRISIPALQGNMGGQKYYLFSIEPSTLLKIGFILHRTRVNDSMAPTYQRLLVPSRLKGITKFINEGGYFPNSIIINFSGATKKLETSFEPSTRSYDSKSRLGMLQIPNAYGIAYIIDGQHRLYGYAASDYKDKSTIPVVAFEKMPSEDQLKLFMDINENQKAVSPSLRLDLEEDLYWNASRIDSRMKALRSSIIKELASNSNYVLYNKISVGEDGATLAFKPFDTAFGKSGLIPSATPTKYIGDTDCCIYDTNNTNSDEEMKCARRKIAQFVNGAYSILEEVLEDDKKKDYLFSNRATFAIIALVGSIHRYLIKTDVINKRSSIQERIKAISPYFSALGQALNELSDVESGGLKGRLGQGADTYWLRLFQDLVSKKYQNYLPEELVQWRETQDEDLQKSGQKLKLEIKDLLRNVVFSCLEEVLGERWENSILQIKNDCEARIIKQIGDNDADSLDNYDWKDYLDISDYKSIIEKNFSSPKFSEAFSIQMSIGDTFKTRKEKLSWMTVADSPKGKKQDALTQSDIDKLWVIRDHLAQFATTD
ncbi:MAG: DGQHR domain-containing protein [Bacteroidales bacterium]|nr:DGQHR domain-containing protein [Bacteroidales bacterium]